MMPIINQNALSDLYKISPDNNAGVVVIDDFLQQDIALRVLDEIPGPSFIGWHGGPTKLESGRALRLLGAGLQSVFETLMSDEFCLVLRNSFGTAPLFASVFGGAAHLTLRGHSLPMHHDWIVLDGRFRSLNLHIYLNHHWKLDFGGRLIIDGYSPIDPLFNRLVIYESAFIKHGHPDPWNGPVPRLALTVYYFTEEPNTKIKDFLKFNPGKDIGYVSSIGKDI